MTLLHTIKGIVFDLDDTLYPQVSFKRSGFRAVASRLAERALADYDTVLATLEDILQQNGPSYGKMFDDVLQRLGIEQVAAADLIEVFRNHVPQIELYPGVDDLLMKLRASKRVGLLTDGLTQVQRNKVAALGLDAGMDALLFSDELATQKPDERLFAWFEQRFDLAASQLLYVGDNPAKDFYGARRRGWRTLRVLTGEYATATPPGDRYSADDTLDKVTELSALLDGAVASRPWR